MKFIKLEILNLASLDREKGETIHFEEGALGDSTIFSIVGPTGSGKSTILDAICQALYNRAPRYPRKKGEKNQSIEIYGEPDGDEKSRLAPTDSRNILTRGKKEGYSKLTFLANNGTVYRAEWYVRMKTKRFDDPTLSLYKITTKNGVQSEEKAEWGELPQIIGLDYEQFLRTVLIAQGSFANFLTSKENERYELLEKLIGCEELYSTIATKIKAQKDEANKAYNQIVANFEAEAQNIIPEEELLVVKARIKELEEIEKQAKEELEIVKKALEWYATNEKHEENIAKFTNAFTEAKGKWEEFSEQANRLSLHDATLPAVNLFREIKNAEKNINSLEKTLKDLGESISKKEAEIQSEEDVHLKQLQSIAQKAAEEMEKQKPHINKAREIKAELLTLNGVLKDKAEDKSNAQTAKDKADEEVQNNEKSIEKAESTLKKAKEELIALQEGIKEGEKTVKQKAEDAASSFDKENNKLKGKDATTLQEAKTSAERSLTDIKNAIRIQGELTTKQNSQKQHLEKQNQLNQRNGEIAELLKGFHIEELEDEFKKMFEAYTLMTSKDWNQHRSKLKDGEPCPLCGATEHPYHNQEKVTSIINGTKELLDQKRATLDKQRKEKEQLTQEQSKNMGILDGIEKSIKTLYSEIAKLEKEWSVIHSSHTDWSEDLDALQTLQPELEKNVEETSSALKEYNELVKFVEKLRKAKEDAEKAQQEYTQTAQEKIQAADKKVTDANTLLEKEKGKSDNLKTQQVEKEKRLNDSNKAFATAQQDVVAKTSALKQEIGNQDPDIFEKSLTDAKSKADNNVKSKTEAISKLREQLKEDKGQETANKTQKEKDIAIAKSKRTELSAWLSNYNEKQVATPLTEESIAQLFASTDNWEAIRATRKRLSEAYTSANTTLENEKTALTDHLKKKPEQEKGELLARKTELEGISNQELIETKAREQRHNESMEKVGSMFSKKQEAELTKREWEEIADAIGGDGKTLRKIAQCYTLRFLIEHANVEIRKFNSRYELQQVKNSLGIRVIDHDRADDVRDTTSLSGGETFIVSLGLALGLSALSSRSISFENLFIDEGFGTLDPETLATVIDSLAMLQSSQGKKVGVISHTDTMSERITTQIRIIKNGNSGSSRIEIYP